MYFFLHITKHVLQMFVRTHCGDPQAMSPNDFRPNRNALIIGAPNRELI